MLKVVDDGEVLGKGVYSVPEALSLVNFDRTDTVPGISRQTLVRWVWGYSHRDGTEVAWSPPLWSPDYAGQGEVNFRDIVELRFVRSLRHMGLSLQSIRGALRLAVDLVGDARPFSTSRFKTDGRRIFLDIAARDGQEDMVDLKQGPRVFREIVEPSLRELEFELGTVARWYPLGNRRRSVVVDPSRSFGRPVAAEGGVPTSVLAAAVRAEGSETAVARLYETPLTTVRDAVAFELRLAA